MNIRSAPPSHEDKSAPANRFRFSGESLQPFDILSKFAISIAGLALSGVIAYATIYNARWATERQIQAQNDNAAAQQKSMSAQLAVTLLPAIVKGTGTEHDVALTILASVAPDQAAQIGTAVLASTKSPTTQVRVKDIINASARAKKASEFSQHLQNARRFRDVSLHASACREYFRALDELPATLKIKFSKQLRDTTFNYEQGRFAEAADQLEKLVTSINPEENTP